MSSSYYSKEPPPPDLIRLTTTNPEEKRKKKIKEFRPTTFENRSFNGNSTPFKGLKV
jgi:hypothetical protein